MREIPTHKKVVRDIPTRKEVVVKFLCARK